MNGIGKLLIQAIDFCPSDCATATECQSKLLYCHDILIKAAKEYEIKEIKQDDNKTNARS